MKKIVTVFILMFISQFVMAEATKQKAQPVNPEEAMPANETAADTNVSTSNQQPTEQSGFSRGSVVRSAFTTEINEREPAENLQKLTNDEGQVMFFTELRDMSGQTAVHRWEYDGNIVAEVEFNVRGPRWRVWSSKQLQPQWTGEWKVSVVNGAGEVISEKELNVETANSQAGSSEPAAASTPASEPATE